MWLQSFQKYQLVICLIISLYLSQVKVDASDIEARIVSHKDVVEKKDLKLNKFDAEKKFKCPSLFGTFPDKEDCSKFYLCVAGISRRVSCPPFTHFDKYRKKCISIIIAVCDKGKDGKKTTVPDKEITKVKDPTFYCPGMSGSYPHPTDCSKYYTCTFFIPIIKICSQKTLFDGIKKECRPESEVNCGSRNKPTSETTLATTPLLPKVTTPESTIPEETTPEPITPEELTTPEESTTPEEPTTTEEETTTAEQTAPETDCEEDDLDCIITETGEIPAWFKCPVELGSHRHPSSNKLFIFCINWKPYVKRCGQDLIYSKEMETCIKPRT